MTRRQRRPGCSGPGWETTRHRELADTMHAAWTGFATNGDPGWPRYGLHHRPTMRFNTTSQVVDDPASRHSPE
jgi:para-nitrobenzyl esterase